MPGIAPENLRLALTVTALVLVLVVLRQALGVWLRRRRVARRALEARRGEVRARGLLEARGYDVVGAQSICSYKLAIDDQELEVPLRADYLVTRDGLRFVAEVKTGTMAPHLKTPATRRQLLEYRLAFDVDGVLLVDAEQGRIHVVRFPFSERHPIRHYSPVGWIAFAVGVAALAAAQWR
jgi:hypothetical protein